MFTSTSARPDPARWRELGLADYVVKPVHPKHLFAAMAASLRESGAPGPRRASASGSMRAVRPVRLSVLVAEDNAVNQMVATRLLEREGHAVSVVSNGKAALAVMAERTFDVVLMDVQMPEMDGLAAIAEVRAREAGGARHVPVIAMTAYTTKGDRERLLIAGFDAYLGKPMRAEELFAALAEATPVQSGPGSATSRLRRRARPPRRSERRRADRTRQSSIAKPPTSASPATPTSTTSSSTCSSRSARSGAPRSTPRSRARDAARLRRAAHTVKGAADHCGGRRAHDAALALEEAGKEGRIDAARPAATALGRELLRLTDALREVQAATKIGRSASPS